MICRRFEEEKCLAVMRVVDLAVKHYKKKGGKGEGYREAALKDWVPSK